MQHQPIKSAKVIRYPIIYCTKNTAQELLELSDHHLCTGTVTGTRCSQQIRTVQQTEPSNKKLDIALALMQMVDSTSVPATCLHHSLKHSSNSSQQLHRYMKILSKISHRKIQYFHSMENETRVQLTALRKKHRAIEQMHHFLTLLSTATERVKPSFRITCTYTYYCSPMVSPICKRNCLPISTEHNSYVRVNQIV